jgi:hypothetical protein
MISSRISTLQHVSFQPASWVPNEAVTVKIANREMINELINNTNPTLRDCPKTRLTVTAHSENGPFNTWTVVAIDRLGYLPLIIRGPLRARASSDVPATRIYNFLGRSLGVRIARWGVEQVGGVSEWASTSRWWWCKLAG